MYFKLLFGMKISLLIHDLYVKMLSSVLSTMEVSIITMTRIYLKKNFILLDAFLRLISKKKLAEINSNVFQVIVWHENKLAYP